MEVKTYIIIEVEKDGHTFSFSLPAGAPFGKAYDACFETLQHIIEFSKKAAEGMKQADTDSDQSSQ